MPLMPITSSRLYQLTDVPGTMSLSSPVIAVCSSSWGGQLGNSLCDLPGVNRSGAYSQPASGAQC